MDMTFLPHFSLVSPGRLHNTKHIISGVLRAFQGLSINCTLTFDKKIVNFVKGRTISWFEMWQCFDLLFVSCYNTV